MSAKPTRSTCWGSWQERIRALNNLPALIRIVWHAGPSVVCGVFCCRAVSALLPLALLAVSKNILDGVQVHHSGGPLPASFWWLVATECGLAALGGTAGRATGYF